MISVWDALFQGLFDRPVPPFSLQGPCRIQPCKHAQARKVYLFYRSIFRAVGQLRCFDASALKALLVARSMTWACNKQSSVQLRQGLGYRGRSNKLKRKDGREEGRKGERGWKRERESEGGRIGLERLA